VIEHPCHRILDAGAEPTALRLQVNERNVLGVRGGCGWKKGMKTGNVARLSRHE
jgi:hypothetical protein